MVVHYESARRVPMLANRLLPRSVDVFLTFSCDLVKAIPHMLGASGVSGACAQRLLEDLRRITRVAHRASEDDEQRTEEKRCGLCRHERGISRTIELRSGKKEPWPRLETNTTQVAFLLESLSVEVMDHPRLPHVEPAYIGSTNEHLLLGRFD
jgi:hypothetical protein